MFKFLRSSPASLLGIDIGPLYIKALALSHNTGNYRIDDFGAIQLAAQPLDNPIVKNTALLAEAIEQLLAQLKTKIKYAAIAIPDCLAITKTITLNIPKHNADLEAQVMLEAAKLLPYSLQEINFDFTVLQSSVLGATQAVNILLAAVKAQTIKPILQALQDAGLQVKIADIQAYAIERASHLLQPQLPQQGLHQIVAIADIGHNHLHLTVLADLKLIYSKEENFSSLVQAYPPQAFAHPAVADKLTTATDEPSLCPSHILFSLNRSLQFFFAANQYSQIHAIVLTGQLAPLPHLTQLISTHFNVPCTIANPLANMSLSPQLNKAALKQESCSLLLCCGLALRRFDHA